MKVIIIIVCIIALLLFLKLFFSRDFFGESCDDMTDEEYDEACRSYQEHWEQMRREERIARGEL